MNISGAKRKVLPLLLLSSLPLTATASEVVRVASWEFHSSFWMSLHQKLLEDAARDKPRDTSSWTAEDRAAWDASVADYRKAGGHDDPSFSNPMVITTDGLTQVTDDATEPAIDAPLADALKRAAPVYRKHDWSDDDAANRFFISYASAMVRESGAELIKKHEAVYHVTWPERVLVYVTPYGGPFGAYTLTGRAGGVITTMSSRDAGYQGLRALEMLLHESSHAVVGPSRGTVADAIAAAGKKHGVTPPRDLWHAILFATSGELTRRHLALRGTARYVPSSDDLFTRVWPKYRGPIEKYWIAYIDGQGTLESAIEHVVEEVSR